MLISVDLNTTSALLLP